MSFVCLAGSYNRNEAINEALLSLKMTPSDLRLSHNVNIDNFRLFLMDRILINPSNLSDFSDSIITYFAENQEMDTIYNRVQAVINIFPKTPVFEKPKSNLLWSENKDIPPSLKEAMDLVINAYEQA